MMENENAPVKGEPTRVHLETNNVCLDKTSSPPLGRPTSMATGGAWYWRVPCELGVSEPDWAVNRSRDLGGSPPPVQETNKQNKRTLHRERSEAWGLSQQLLNALELAFSWDLCRGAISRLCGSSRCCSKLWRRMSFGSSRIGDRPMGPCKWWVLIPPFVHTFCLHRNRRLMQLSSSSSERCLLGRCRRVLLQREPRPLWT
jgi:hypothetical protein